jgi:hypothetical protein
MKVNSGHDLQADALGGGGAGATGSATSPTTTGFTTTGLTSSAHVGKLVQLGAVYGVITANTATAVTVDRWYTPGTPGGAAATPPTAGTFVIVPGNAPGMFMAITANNTAAGASDTTLTGEITTAGGGLIRKLATYAHTAAAATYTLTGVFTANVSDTLPVTIAKMATFQSMVAGRMLHETLVSPTATLSASGDALTLTQTVTM